MAYQKVAKEVIPDQASTLCRVLSFGFFPCILKAPENARKIKVTVADVESDVISSAAFLVRNQFRSIGSYDVLLLQGVWPSISAEGAP